jgi:hypothetical protein
MYKVWHADDENAADWLISGLALSGAAKESIPNPGSPGFLNLPEVFKKILRLDKPDLILTSDVAGVDIPIVSIELTTTTPQSQHAKQRIPRIIAAAEADVPAIYVIPGQKLSGGSTYSVGPDLYYGLERIQKLNNIPVFAFHWPSIRGVLQNDPKFPNQPSSSAASILDLFSVIKELIIIKAQNTGWSACFSNTFLISEMKKQAAVAATANVVVNNYLTLEEINTADLGSYLRANSHMSVKRISQTLEALPKRIKSRDKSIIFKPAGRLFEHAGDPYVGMLAFFDYAFCRVGRSVEERSINLIHMPIKAEVSEIKAEFAPKGYYSYWDNKCPFSNPGVPSVAEQFSISHHLQYGCVFNKSKPLRILGYFSDLIVFKDSVLVF